MGHAPRGRDGGGRRAGGRTRVGGRGEPAPLSDRLRPSSLFRTHRAEQRLARHGAAAHSRPGSATGAASGRRRARGAIPPRASPAPPRHAVDPAALGRERRRSHRLLRRPLRALLLLPRRADINPQRDGTRYRGADIYRIDLVTRAGRPADAPGVHAQYRQRRRLRQLRRTAQGANCPRIGVFNIGPAFVARTIRRTPRSSSPRRATTFCRPSRSATAATSCSSSAWTGTARTSSRSAT